MCFVNSLHLSEKVWGKQLQTTQWELGQIPGLSFSINVQILYEWGLYILYKMSLYKKDGKILIL